MSLNHLINGGLSGSLSNLRVNDSFHVTEIIVPITWDPNLSPTIDLTTSSSTKYNSSIEIHITLTNTQITAGAVTAPITIKSNICKSTSNIFYVVSNYSDLPNSFNTSASFGDPIIFVSNQMDGQFQFQIMNNGYGAMTTNATLQLNFLIT
jgi:hypothetical protein